MRDKDEATRKILQMTVDGKQNQVRPKLRWRDLVKEDMEVAEERNIGIMIRASTLLSVEADR